LPKIVFDPKKRVVGILFASATALVWGFLAIFIKVATDDLSPISIVWSRFSIAFVLLAVWSAARRPEYFTILLKPPLLLVFAALCLTMNYIGFATGIDLTTAANGQVFIQFGPFLLAIAGILIYRERLSVRQFSGFIVAGAGFYMFYTDQVDGIFSGESIYQTGIAWLIIGATAWAFFSVFQKWLVQKHPAQQLNLYVYALPSLILLPFVPFSEFMELSPVMWLLTVALGVNTLVAYGCLAEAFRLVEANKISVIITLNPIITFILLATMEGLQVAWIKHEVITILGAGGAVLVIAGAIMVVLPKKAAG
jgi:drug/metabolite transporter (DMT)-like permease